MRAEVAYIYGGAPKNDALADEPPNQEEDAEFKDYNIVATAEKIEDAEEYLNQFYLCPNDTTMGYNKSSYM